MSLSHKRLLYSTCSNIHSRVQNMVNSWYNVSCQSGELCFLDSLSWSWSSDDLVSRPHINLKSRPGRCGRVYRYREYSTLEAASWNELPAADCKNTPVLMYEIYHIGLRTVILFLWVETEKQGHWADTFKEIVISHFFPPQKWLATAQDVFCIQARCTYFRRQGLTVLLLSGSPAHTFLRWEHERLLRLF